MATKHGMRNTRQYRIWNNMVQRCVGKSNPRYNGYGGRGVKVCDKWLTFSGFWEDMKDGYSSELTIERKNNDGNYCPSNCKWASYTEQARNTRRTALFNGKTLSEWSELLGIKRSTLAQRHYVYGWSVDRVLSKQV